ncbi:MAG: hypothetical protein WCP40_06500 [Opitutae bacterium]
MSIPTADPSEWFDFGKPSPTKYHSGYGGISARVRVIPLKGQNRDDKNGLYVNCTSTGDDGEKQLSPFCLGPCHLYEGYTAKKLENAWQYSKLYHRHIGDDGKPNAEYFAWAKTGWSSWRGERYPFGKSVRSSLHWWDGQCLGRVEARKRIYVPLYVQQVVQQPYFKGLKEIWESEIKPDAENTLYLMDFDAYEYDTISEVLNNPARSMGHGFVLAMLFTGDVALQECVLRS